MSKKKSLEYLPNPQTLKAMMDDVSALWEESGLPHARHITTPVTAILPLSGGSMELLTTATGSELRFRHWPYQDVVLTRTQNSSSWIIEPGLERKAIHNAWKMLKPLFMNDEQLLSYTMRSLTNRGVTPPFTLVNKTLDARFPHHEA